MWKMDTTNKLKYLLVPDVGHFSQWYPQAAPIEQQHFSLVISALIGIVHVPASYFMKQGSCLISIHSALLGSKLYPSGQSQSKPPIELMQRPFLHFVWSAHSLISENKKHFIIYFFLG